jgi:hypothetical protein
MKNVVIINITACMVLVVFQMEMNLLVIAEMQQQTSPHTLGNTVSM